MNTIVQARSLSIPGASDFAAVWKVFFSVVDAVAVFRAREYGPRAFERLSPAAADELIGAADSPEFANEVEEMIRDEHERYALAILYEELLYLAWRYRSACSALDRESPFETYSVATPERYADENGRPDEPDAVENIETGIGSVTQILKKLPKSLSL